MNTLLKEQLLFIRRGGETQRFHSVLTIQADTVGHHSFGVAWWLWLMTGGAARTELIMAGLAHDLSEHQIGDIPAPVKRALGDARAQIHKMESQLLQAVGLAFELTETEQRQLKLADALDGMMFCIRERTLGNLEIVSIYEKFYSYAKERLDGRDAFRDEEELLYTVNKLWKEIPL